MRRRLPVDCGVEGQNDFADFFGSDTVKQAWYAQLIGPNGVKRAECAAQHVIAAFENPRAFHGPQICHVLNHANLAVGAFFTLANLT